MKKTSRLPRILLTNDDGIAAPGLAALSDVAHSLSKDIWIVAPEHDESGTGQSLSLHHPLRCHPRGKNRWAVAGTPADCVAIAAARLMAKSRPALILSGVNAGSNTGDDVNLSGTLGAAFMGLMLGIPSIAISLACATRRTARWETARTILPDLLRYFVINGWQKGTCLSINIPDLPAKKITGFTWARQGMCTTSHVHIDARIDLRDQEYYWMTLRDQERAAKGNIDHAILKRGRVAVTVLSLDRSVEVDMPGVAFGFLKRKPR